MKEHLRFIAEAIKEAKKSVSQGGEPIGSILVKDNKIIGRGHNQRLQKSNPILHAEMDCIQNAGRLKSKDYKKCTLYSTLSPCDMCSGTILLYKIPRIVIGENETFKGPEAYLKKRKVKITNLNLQECKNLMKEFIKQKPEIWKEDIGK
jgi:cytosine deaminase